MIKDRVGGLWIYGLTDQIHNWLSGSLNTNTLPSSKPSNGAESGAVDATDRASSGSNQQYVVQPMAQQVSRPNMPLGGAAEGFGPGQQSRHPLAQQQQPSGFGFSKYQLTLLRNQILAFKKLRARKVCDEYLIKFKF